MTGHSILEAIKERPIAVWALLLYLAHELVGLVYAAFVWQQKVYSNAPYDGPFDFVIYHANAVLFMTVLVGSSIYALWRKMRFGLVVSCLVVCMYLYRSVLVDVLGSSETVYLDVTGAESTAFLHVYGDRLHQLLLLVLASIPIWSRASRRYVGWGAQVAKADESR